MKTNNYRVEKLNMVTDKPGCRMASGRRGFKDDHEAMPTYEALYTAIQIQTLDRSYKDRLLVCDVKTCKNP